MAMRRLGKEYKEITKNGPEGILAGPASDGNLFEWECLIAGPTETPFEGGLFAATLSFPRGSSLDSTLLFKADMPNTMTSSLRNAARLSFEPPEDEIYMPHVPPEYLCGRNDPNGYELASERWSPVQSVEKILLSVLSMLAEPNDESGANVDASKMWREDRTRFLKITEQVVQKSLGLL